MVFKSASQLFFAPLSSPSTFIILSEHVHKVSQFLSYPVLCSLNLIQHPGPSYILNQLYDMLVCILSLNSVTSLTVSAYSGIPPISPLQGKLSLTLILLYHTNTLSPPSTGQPHLD